MSITKISQIPQIADLQKAADERNIQLSFVSSGGHEWMLWGSANDEDDFVFQARMDEGNIYGCNLWETTSVKVAVSADLLVVIDAMNEMDLKLRELLI